MKSARNFDEKFREEYHNLWNFRKQRFLKKQKSSIPAIFSERTAIPSPSKPFYYKDSYEISSVKHFLYLMSSFVDKNEKIKAEKARLDYKKTLLSQMKFENSLRSNDILKKNRKINLEKNRLFSPKAMEKIEKKEILEELELLSIGSQEKPKKNPYEEETKWMTLKEVDAQLSRIMTSNYKDKKETPFCDQLLCSPMWKKGARGIDHAFNNYLDRKFKENEEQNGIKIEMPKIQLLKKNPSMDETQLKSLKIKEGRSSQKILYKRMSINKI